MWFSPSRRLPTRSIYSMSDSLQITTYANGSLYGVDAGVEPHVRLNNAESFYDREALVEMIHNLKKAERRNGSLIMSHK